jgi:hypothetical protein
MAERPVFSLMVQKFDTDPVTGLRRQTSNSPYVRLRNGSDVPPVFLQHGRCWTESSQEIDPIPDWVLAALEAMPAATRLAIGWAEDAESA